MGIDENSAGEVCNTKDSTRTTPLLVLSFPLWKLIPYFASSFVSFQLPGPPKGYGGKGGASGGGYGGGCAYGGSGKGCGGCAGKGFGKASGGYGGGPGSVSGVSGPVGGIQAARLGDWFANGRWDGLGLVFCTLKHTKTDFKTSPVPEKWFKLFKQIYYSQMIEAGLKKLSCCSFVTKLIYTIRNI